MSEYLTSLVIEFKLSGVWIDVSEYVVGEVEGEYGLPGESPIDRVATTGYIKFALNNVSNIFTPGLTESLGDFGKGTKVKMTCFYGGESWIKFYGSIEGIDIDSKDYGERRVLVSCIDWMNNANTYPLKQTDIVLNATADVGVETIVDLMPTPPLGTLYTTGIDTFPTIFDTTKPNAKAVTEFQKLAMSELCYIYLRRKRYTGEQLVVESRNTRNTSVLELLPTTSSSGGFALQMQGGFEKLMNGSFMKLHQKISYAFDNNMKDLSVVNGEYVLNDITVKVYPRKVDANISVLFTLQKAMVLGAGETVTIRGTYKDAYGIPVNACGFTNIATNVAYTLSGGAITIDPALAIFGSEAFRFDIANAGGAITLLTLTVSLKAIHTESIESNIQDSGSIVDYDFCSTVFDQAYQDSLNVGIGLAWTAVYKSARPRTVAKKVFLMANQDSNSMSAFLNLDIGSLIKIVEGKSQINGSYYIVRIGFKITIGGLIDYWYEVQEATSFSSVFWQFDTVGRCEFGNLIFGVG